MIATVIPLSRTAKQEDDPLDILLRSDGNHRRILDEAWLAGIFASSEQGVCMARYKVGYFIGSLATASINRLLAKALVRLAPADLEMTEIPFKDLPLYSYDYDANYPPVATEFKNAIAGVDAVLFVTPEYNRSIPGALKNAIDWASRPYGKNAFTRKPSAVIGTSPGKIGTAVGQQHLRSILAFCNSPLMNSIEAYIQFERGLINEDGAVTSKETEEFLRQYMVEFLGFIERVYTVLPRNQ
jgi:chromate reductase, NAD(P)H dehydrogenase (quinone)